jgi:hypothetical protein
MIVPSGSIFSTATVCPQEVSLARFDAFRTSRVLLLLLLVAVWHLSWLQVRAAAVQVEALRATDLAASRVLDALPAGKDAAARLGQYATDSLTAFSEAFEFVVGELEAKGTARLRLKEQVDNQREVQVLTQRSVFFLLSNENPGA